MSQALIVIPARYASTRLPGKMLLDRTGKPLIVHVLERVQQARCAQRVIVATDDARIERAVRDAGGQAVMTRAEHPNGTARIAEAVQHIEPEGPGDRVVVNVQGDEPEIDPDAIDALVDGFTRDAEASMATIASPFASDEDPADPNIVKLVLDQQGQALYFSRALIPYDRDDTAGVQPLKHIGLYAYRRSFLEQYVRLPATPLEQAESLEQLRALEHGHAIAAVRRNITHHGIDTEADYEAFVQRAGRSGG